MERQPPTLKAKAAQRLQRWAEDSQRLERWLTSRGGLVGRPRNGRGRIPSMRQGLLGWFWGFIQGVLFIFSIATLISLFVRSFTRNIIHCSFYLFIQWLIWLFVWLIDRSIEPFLSFIPSFLRSRGRSLCRSLIHSFPRELVHAFTQSFNKNGHLRMENQISLSDHTRRQRLDAGVRLQTKVVLINYKSFLA